MIILRQYVSASQKGISEVYDQDIATNFFVEKKSV